MFKAWRFNAVVSALQLILGYVVYLQWNVAIAAATVGFITLCLTVPVVEGKIPQYCEMMEQILGVTFVSAFAIAVGVVAMRFLYQADGYLGWGFFGAIAGLLLVVLLLFAVAFFLTLIVVGDYKSMGMLQGSPLIFIACLLPAGIGLLFGAVYFSIVRLRKRVATA